MNRLRGVIIVLLAVMLRPGAAAAQAWESLGPDGGSFREVCVDPAAPARLVAATEAQAGRLFISIDGAATWSPIAGWSGPVLDAAFPPGGGTLFALSSSGVRTWRPGEWAALPTFPSGFSPRYIRPTSAGIFVAGSVPAGAAARPAILFLAPNGREWTSRSSGLGTEGEWGAFAAVADGLRLVAAFNGSPGRLLCSVDGGVRWLPASTLVDTSVRDAAFDRHDPLRAFAATTLGILRSLDGGRTWATCTHLDALRVRTDPAVPGAVYGGANGYFFRSLDGGDEWTSKYDSGLGLCSSLAANGTSIVFASGIGLRVTRDRGATWSAADAGIRALRFQRVAVHPFAPNAVVAVDASGRFLRSLDFGETWTDAQASLAPTDLTGLLFERPDRLAASSSSVQSCGSG